MRATGGGSTEAASGREIWVVMYGIVVAGSVRECGDRSQRERHFGGKAFSGVSSHARSPCDVLYAERWRSAAGAAGPLKRLVGQSIASRGRLKDREVRCLKDLDS